ncbi:LysR family transcriptional regulator [Sphingobium lactosutens]|uniref:LysR family transcriptional regulator n=1 Tax=Sphingobium lactosutens TaxID=522773 RepID=UPI00137883D7|nr:LysR family transcriptional regulator [Sphingobium lactosutens]
MFVAAADAGSFSEAGRRLGISPSAVSQAIRGLEERLGAPLFRRSTRSLSLTDAGNDYLLAAAPALSQLRRAADAVTGRSGRPAGPLRLTMPRAPFDLLIAPMLVDFQGAFPEIEVEIAVEARLIDIVKQGYDAGLRYGNHLDKHMVAIPVAPKSEAILAASPAYLHERRAPDVPEDLLDHRALMCRSQASGSIMPWTLHRAGDAVQITPSAATIVHDLASQIDLAARGLAIVNAPAAMLADHLSAGRLLRVLPEWSSPLDAVYLYFPSRRGQSAAVRAFVAFLKVRLDGTVPLDRTASGRVNMQARYYASPSASDYSG